MNLANETIRSTATAIDQYLLIAAGTGLELKRPRPQLVPAPWTADMQQSVRLENSTIQQAVHKDLDQQIIALCEAAKEENFEDGMESEFSKELIDLVRRG